MIFSMKKWSYAAIAGLAFSVISTTAMAAFPERSVKLVIPYTPGGSADMLSRLLADNMSKSLGQPVIVENKPGASTRIAAQHVARSNPDGYTLFLASNSSMVLNPLLYKDVGYDAEKDYSLIGIATEMPLVVVTNKDVPANTLSEFIAYAKEKKGDLNYASIGLGNPLQLATQLLISGTDMDLTHIAYNGSSPALMSLAANDTQLMVDGIITSLPFIQDGRLKALAVGSSERLAVLPDVPTVSEAAVPGYQAATWFGVAAPAATPEDRKQRLQEALNIAMQDEGIVEKMQSGGMIMQKPRTQEEIDAFLERDRKQWRAVVEENNISLD